MGVVVVGDNAMAVDGRDGEEEDAAIILVEGNDGMGPLSLSPPPSISIPPMMSALSYSPVAPLLRPFKPGVGGGIDEMTPKEGESDRGVRLFPFSEAGGSLLSSSHSPPPFYLITPILTV